MNTLTYIRVEGDDLAAGDILNGGYEIVEIDDPVLLPGWGRVRTSIIRWVNTQVEEQHTFRNFSLHTFDIVGGPKLEAANRDNSLVVRAGAGYLWRGLPIPPVEPEPEQHGDDCQCPDCQLDRAEV